MSWWDYTTDKNNILNNGLQFIVNENSSSMLHIRQICYNIR